jgi:hypothetical protein
MKENAARSALVSSLQEKWNVAFTENGTLAHESTLNKNLDLFAKIASARTNLNLALDLFSEAYGANKILALRTLFWARDVRGGQGERKTFRTLLNWLAQNDPKVVKANIENIPFFGRWDDLFALVGTNLEDEALNYYACQLREDQIKMVSGVGISLAAKWAPSINTSSKQTRAFGRLLCKKLGWDEKHYRQVLSKMRAKLALVERNLSSKEVGAIDYSAVPSRASLIYRKAFSRHDGPRYVEFLNQVAKGEKKINAAALYPYDVVGKYLSGYFNRGNAVVDQTVEALWNALPNYLEGNEHNGLVMADISWSMFSGNTPMPILVSLSLAIYIAERNKGKFHNSFISFTAEPKIHELSGINLASKISHILRNTPVGYNTDFTKAFREILRVAVERRLPQSEMPEVVYVVSDMQFDSCGSSQTNFQQLKQDFAACGYEMPKMVFWNVAAKSGNPITLKDANCVLVSGCNPNIFKAVLSSRSPMEMMLETLGNDRYDVVVLE